MSDEVMKTAIRQRDRLLDCAKEFRHHGRRATSPAGKELAEMDAKACEDAAEMMQRLGTEVTRLRLGIQHNSHGRLDRIALERMTRNWNSDPATS